MDACLAFDSSSQAGGLFDRWGLYQIPADPTAAYDRKSQVGRLDNALDEAVAREWTVVDMKQD